MKKHTLWITGCCGLWILLAAAAPAQRQRNSAADAAGDPFAEEFSIITQRNIFDPNRQASRPRDTVQVTRTPAPTPVPVRTIDLYGAFIRDNEAIALVGGDTVLSGELRIGDKLGDWEVTAINTMGVLLTKEDDMMSWAVGQRCRRPATRTGRPPVRSSVSSPRARSPAVRRTSPITAASSRNARR